ncbi:MAG: hypothetical protein ACRDT4_21400 [Micromonosporaceae bacterium]
MHRGIRRQRISQALWGYLLWFATADGVDRAAGVAVVEAAEQAPVLATLPVSFFTVPLFALGLLLFAAAPWRAGSVPRWVPVAIVLADLLAPVFPGGAGEPADRRRGMTWREAAGQ